MRAIVIGGAVAGVLDLADAIIFHGLRGVAPIRIPQSIASGLMGPAAYQGGWGAAALGVVLHFVIAFSWAAVFWLAASRWEVLRRRWVAAGLVFGAIVYVSMNYLVLPMSRFAVRTPNLPVLANGVLAVVVLVGLPIAWAARR